MKGLLFRYMVCEYMGHDEHEEGHNHARSALGDCLESLTAGEEGQGEGTVLLRWLKTRYGT
jgi:hypothetical protein